MNKMIEKKLGKIERVSFGYGGYQECMIGISFDLSCGVYGVSDFWGNWNLERSDGAQWTEQDRINSLGEMVMRINTLLQQAKVDSVDRLKGIPVEVVFDGQRLKEWRVLTEVL